MANQNLSQFGEKLFVADADHTFIWDSTASISKRVSRNSWLNSGTLTSDAPVTISQTWGAVGQTFTALKVNAAGTSGANSAIGSLLADFQEGGVSKVRVRKDGTIFVPGGSNSSQGLSTTANYMAFVTGLGSINQYGSTLYSTTGLLNLGAFSFNVGTITFDAAGKLDWGDAAIVKDSTNTLALRNGTSAQTFNVYGTYTSGTSYERLTLSAPSAANAIIGTNKGSGGGTARGLEFQTDGVTRMTIAATGEISTGNNRIGVSPGGLINNGGALGIYFGYSGTSPGFTIASAQIIMTAPIFKFNVLDNTGPALKRSSTTLQTRLADDSAFAAIQGKLTTETAFTATTVTPTGFITLYDSTGTAYKVPCVPA